MGNAPERISLLPEHDWAWCEGSPVTEPERIEYVRADRIEALEAENARLREAAQAVISAYNEANPMRSADFHRDGCNCCRCAFDLLRAALKQEGGE